MKWQTSSVFQSAGRQAVSAQPLSPSAPSATIVEPTPNPQAVRPATILVADDDKSIRTVLTQALGRLGHHVRSTGNGTTLWKWVQEGAGDLVITDVMMPDGSGLDLLPKISSHPARFENRGDVGAKHLNDRRYCDGAGRLRISAKTL